MRSIPSHLPSPSRQREATGLITFVLLLAIASTSAFADTGSANDWQLSGLGTLRLGKAAPRTKTIGGTLTVQTDQLEGIPKNTVLQMSGTLQGATLKITGYKVTQGDYLHINREKPSYEYALTIDAEFAPPTAPNRLNGAVFLVKSVRFHSDSGQTIQHFSTTGARPGGSSIVPPSDSKCGDMSYDRQTQCCVHQALISKNGPIPQMVDLKDCPNRKPLDNYKVLYDGCSRVPNNVTLFRDGSFSACSSAPPCNIPNPTLACDVHDQCYQTCSTDPWARLKCDAKLLKAAATSCLAMSPWESLLGGQNRCVQGSIIYFFGVRILASGPFEEDQKNACKCNCD